MMRNLRGLRRNCNLVVQSRTGQALIRISALLASRFFASREDPFGTPEHHSVLSDSVLSPLPLRSRPPLVEKVNHLVCWVAAAKLLGEARDALFARLGRDQAQAQDEVVGEPEVLILDGLQAQDLVAQLDRTTLFTGITSPGAATRKTASRSSGIVKLS